MTERSKPVWVWLPGHAGPVRAGIFTLTDHALGSFVYDEAYRQLPGRVALDPQRLPITRSAKSVREVKQKGLFGVFRDASPEGYGLSLLEHRLNASLSDPLDRLEASVGDAVSGVEVCEDLAPKAQWRAPASSVLIEALATLEPDQASSRAARTVMQVDGTSLGGERPKITVMHEGQLWIAKMRDRGDAPNAPLREFVAMQIARAAGLQVAETRFAKAGEHQLFLVKRFDREVTTAGEIHRRLYASAHTVLGLDADSRGDRARSYVSFARELQRWCATADRDVAGMQRELWRRMAFNAVCGNGDDHPRNHGLVHTEDGWSLSPAFDIAPYITFSHTLAMAMAVNRKGEQAATAEALLADCRSFGCTRAEALDFLHHACAVLRQKWPDTVASAGYDPGVLPPVEPTWLQLDGVTADEPAPRRPRSGSPRR